MTRHSRVSVTLITCIMSSAKCIERKAQLINLTELKKKKKNLEPFTDNGGEKTRTPETHNDDLQKIPHTKSRAIGPYEDVLTSVKRRKLKWYGNREQFKEGDEEADRGNDGKTTSQSGLALNGIYYYGKLRTARSGGSWL